MDNRSYVIILFLISVSFSSRCYYNTENVENIDATCHEVSSDLALDLKKNARLTKELTISPEYSKIPVIPANSSLSSFTLLKRLTMEKLGIEKIIPGAFFGLDNLEELDLNDNKLTEILPGTFNNLSKLQNIYLSNNLLGRISADSFRGLNALRVLYMKNNLISHIEDGSFDDLVAFERLLLDGNNLTVLQKGLFGGLSKKLLYLGLNENPLKEIPGLEFNVDVENVDIWYSDLKTVNLSVRHKIKQLDFMRSKIEEIDFVNFHTEGFIEELDLSENRIVAVRNIHLAKVGRLDFNQNRITTFEVFPRYVKSLNLESNKIKKLNPVSNPNDYIMEGLYLSSNEISVASCFGLSSLKYLELNDNQISAIKENSFADCTNLKNLYLSRNKIEFIEPNAFSGAALLETIFLGENKLQNLNHQSFSGLNLLSEIRFNGNQISSFDVDSFVKMYPKLNKVRIDNNSFICEDLDIIFRKLKWYHITSFYMPYVNRNQCKSS